MSSLTHFNLLFLYFPYRIIVSLPPATQQLMALLFGTWFRIVNHSEFNTMSSEAVAKSVAGSLFHTCSDDPKRVQRAVEVLQILIDDFGVSNMFGRRNIQYFAEMTRTGKEKYRFEYRYPRDGSVPCKYLSCSGEEASCYSSQVLITSEPRSFFFFQYVEEKATFVKCLSLTIKFLCLC